MDRVAIVTGATSGIGKAIAKDLLQQGYHVTLLGRSNLRGVEEELRALGQVTAIPCDVREQRRVENAIKLVMKTHGHIDVLVNNAGYSYYGTVEETELEELTDVMQTNYFGAVYGTKAVLPIMKKQGSGHIIFIGSVLGRFGAAHAGAYCASKFAVAGFAESLAKDMKGGPIAVTLINPGRIKTNIENHPSYKRQQGTHKEGAPPEVVAAVVRKALRERRFEYYVPRKCWWTTLLHTTLRFFRK